MGKKNKAEKKGKNGKKKDELLIEPHDLAAVLVGFDACWIRQVR